MLCIYDSIPASSIIDVEDSGSPQFREQQCQRHEFASVASLEYNVQMRTVRVVSRL